MFEIDCVALLFISFALRWAFPRQSSMTEEKGIRHPSKHRQGVLLVQVQSTRLFSIARVLEVLIKTIEFVQ